MMNKLNGCMFLFFTTWDKISAGIKKEFDSEPVYNKEYLKTWSCRFL